MTGTWLPAAGGTATLLEQVSGHCPAYGAALDEVLDAIWDQDVIDAPTLALCRTRINQLLGGSAEPEGVDPSLADGVRHWPTDGRFDERLRTILGYVEQLLLDAQELDDAQVKRVVDTIGEDGFLILTYACGVFETTQRAELILGIGGKIQ
jgi:alkylhydroperoxidase family enzyme